MLWFSSREHGSHCYFVCVCVCVCDLKKIFFLADISHYHRPCAFTYFEGFLWSPPVFRSVALLYLVKKTWRSLFFFFLSFFFSRAAMNCGVLIGRFCWVIGNPETFHDVKETKSRPETRKNQLMNQSSKKRNTTTVGELFRSSNCQLLNRSSNQRETFS